VKIRFQADAELNQIILLAVVRREPTVEFTTAAVAGLESLGDPEVLALAARQGRLLVTHDQSTMPDHFSRFIETATSPGLLVVPQHLPPTTVADELLLVWYATDSEEWTNRISYLPI
jgi:predicted nuclease of predicted toxin-antitoxin system